MTRSAAARPGRPVGSDGSARARILEAARSEFAHHGFRGATMRGIARRAGVDVALLSHYFDNKDGLFAATVELPAGAADAIAEALSAPPEDRAERLTRAYLSLWENPTSAAQIAAMMRTALAGEQSSRRVEELIMGIIGGERLGPLLAGHRTGFALAITHLAGVCLGRYVVGAAPLAEPDLETIVRRVTPAVALHLSNPDDTTP